MASTSSGRSMDDASIEKKFANVKNTQESIQSIASWAMHHKNQHSKVVEIWLDVLNNSKPARRLTLFYICNEVVQTCKRKRATSYKESFQQVLPQAAALVRDATVKSNIERIFTIWQERGIYESDFVNELMAVLNNTGNVSKARSSNSNSTKPQTSSQSATSAATTAAAAANVIEEFKPSLLREFIGQVSQLEKDVQVKRRRLNITSIDELSQKLLKQSKDRSHSKLYAQQVEDIHKNLSEFVSNVENEIEERQRLLEMLEQSEVFYDVQYGEARIVANAYKNFGTRVSNLRKRLEDVKKTLPDPLSPIPSPTLDAPSPGDSPTDNTIDNTDAVDMELSDDREDAYSPGSAGSINALDTSEGTKLALTEPSSTDAADVGTLLPSSEVVVDVCSPVAVSTTSNVACLTNLPISSDVVLTLLSSLKSQPLTTDITAAKPSAGVREEIVHKAYDLPLMNKPPPARSPERVSTPDIVKLENRVVSPAYDSSIFAEAVRPNNIKATSYESEAIEETVRHENLKSFSYLPRNQDSKNTSLLTSIMQDFRRDDSPVYETPGVTDPVVMTSLRSPFEPQMQESALSPMYMNANDDEGGLTPVLDEKPEIAEIPMSPPRVVPRTNLLSARPAIATESNPLPPTTRVTDPIAFLNQMLSQSKPAQTGSSTSFLQSLSLLTKGLPSNSKLFTSDNDDDVFLGGYVDNSDQSAAAFDDQTKTSKSVIPIPSPSSAVEGILNRVLPRSPSQPLPPPPPPFPQMTSTELPPPPPPPPICGVLDLPADVHFLSSVSTSQTDTTSLQSTSLERQQSSHVRTDSSLSGQFASAIPSSFAHQSAVSSPRGQLPISQLSAPPPPPPLPLCVPSGPRQDWPTVDTSDISFNEHHVSPRPVFTSQSGYAEDDSEHIEMSGSAGDSREFAERLKRRTSMQFSPGSSREQFQDPLYDQHESVYNEFQNVNDVTPVFTNANYSRAHFDGPRLPAWSGERPVRGSFVSRGANFRSEPPQHFPSDFQYQPRPNRLPSQSVYPPHRGPVPNRFSRGGHFTRY